MFHVTAVLNLNNFDIHLIPITFIKNRLSTTAINPVVNSLSFFDSRHLKKLTKKQTLPLLCASLISDKYSTLHSQMKISPKKKPFLQSGFTLKYLHAKKEVETSNCADCECERSGVTAEVRLYWSAKTGQPLSLNGLKWRMCVRVKIVSSYLQAFEAQCVQKNS